MLTLDQFIADPRFSALDTQGKKFALDEFYASEATDKQSGEAVDGPEILKTALDLGDRFEQETEFRKPFVRREFEALDSFRRQLRGTRQLGLQQQQARLEQGITGDTFEGVEVLRKDQERIQGDFKSAVNSFVAEKLRIEQDLAAQGDFESDIRRDAQKFLATNPLRAEQQRERENEGFFDAVAEAGTDVIEQFRDEERAEQLRVAEQHRLAMVEKLQDRMGLGNDEAFAMADSIIEEEDQTRAKIAQGGFSTDALGEVSIPPVDLARLPKDEIEARVAGLDASPSAKARFLRNLDAYRTAAAEQVVDSLANAVAQGDIALPDSKRGPIDALLLESTSGETEDLNKVFSNEFRDPENLQKFLNDLEESDWKTLRASSGNIRSSLASMVGGLSSFATSLAGANELSQNIARGAESIGQANQTSNELRNLNAFQKFGSDLAGTAPDLALAALGGVGGRAATSLFGSTGKAATRLSLAGVSAGSGLGSGLRTYNEARAKGFDGLDSFRLGAESFLITSGVTALGGATAGVEGVLAGQALVGVKKEFKQYLGTVLKGASNDAIEEVADTVISAMTVQQELNPDMTLKQHVRGALDAAALGAALGGGLPAIAGSTDIEFNKKTVVINRLKTRFAQDPTSLSEEEVARLADEAHETLLDVTEGDETRAKLAEQANRDRLEKGEPVSSVEALPSRPAGSGTRLEEPTENSDESKKENENEKEGGRRSQRSNRDQADQSPDAGTDQGAEVRTPEVTAKDLARAEKIASEKSFSTSSSIVRDAVRDGVVDELIRNPEASDAILRLVARQSASKASRNKKSQENQEKSGNVSRLVDEQGANIDLEGSGPDGSQEAQTAESISQIDRAIEALPEGQRQVFNLKAEGFTNKEIAERLGLSANAVAKRLKSGRASLKAELQKSARGADAQSVNPDPELQEGSDAQVFNRAVEALRNDPQENVKQLASRMQLVEKPSAAQTKVAELGAFLGRRVLFVRGIDQNGVFTPSTPDTVFINENAQRAEYQVLAHEALHSFRVTNPESYANLVAAVDADLSAYVGALPSRKRDSQSETKEEFLADFFADKLIDKQFLSKLASENPSVFTKFADFVRAILDRARSYFKQTKDLDTKNFLADVERAEQALIDTLVDVKTGRIPVARTNESQTNTPPANATVVDNGNDASEPASGTQEEQAEPVSPDERSTEQETSGSPESPGASPEPEPLFPEFAPDDKFHQFAGGANKLSPRDSASIIQMAEDIEGDFPVSTLSLDAAGERVARDFLANLTNPVFTKKMVDRYVDEGDPTRNKRFQVEIMAVGAARSALVDYAVRYAEKNPKGGRVLIYDIMRVSSDFAHQITYTSEGDPDYISGLYLRSLQTFKGGNLLTLFDATRKSQKDFATEGFSKESKEYLDALTKAGLSDAEFQSLIDERVSLALAEDRARIAKATSQAFGILQKVASIMKGRSTPEDSGARLENPTSDPFEDFFKLTEIDKDSATLDDFDAAVAAFEAIPQEALEARIGKKRAKAARKTAKQATVDRLGASIIRRASALGDSTTRTKDPIVAEFEAFVKTRPGREDFIKKYVELGGSLDRAADVFDAQQKLDQDADTKKVELKEAREARAAEKKALAAESRAARAFKEAQAFVDGIGEEKSKSKSAAEKAPTRQKIIADFINLKRAEQTQDQLETSLAALKNADGTPMFTQSQIEQASTRAVLARKAAKDSEAAAKEAADAKKREQDAETFAEKVRKDAEATQAARVKKAKQAQEKSQKKALAQQKKVDAIVSKLKGIVEPVNRKFKVSVNKLINEFMSLTQTQKDSSLLRSQLRNVYDKDGQPALTEDQIEQIVVEAAQARATALAARTAKNQAEEAAREVARVERLFRPAKPRPKSQTRSVNQIIMDEYIKHPTRTLGTREERLEFLEEVLKEKSTLDDSLIPQLARDLEGDFEARLLAKKSQLAERFARSLSRGGALSQDAVLNAVRLEIYDPKQDLLSSVAALRGWQGLTEKQTAALVESQRRIDAVSAGAGLHSKSQSRVVASEARKIAIILNTAARINPSTNELVSAWFKGAVFSAISTHSTSALAGAYAITAQLGRELALSLTSLKDNRGTERITGIFKDMANSFRSWLDSYKDMVFELIISTNDGSTATQQLNVEQDQIGGAKNSSVDAQVHLDALTKLAKILDADLPRDLAAAKKGDIRAAGRLLKNFARVATGMRLTFRLLGSVDSAVTKAYISTQTEVLAYRENRKLLALGEGGLTPEAFAKITEAAHSEAAALTAQYVEQGIFDGGSTRKNLAGWAMAAATQRDRAKTIRFEALAQAGVNPNLAAESIVDIQAQIGTGAFDKTIIGKIGETINRGGTAARDIPYIGGLTSGVFLALRTPSVVADYVAWALPGVNLPRTIHLAYLKARNPDAIGATFASAASEHVSTRRLLTAVTSYPLTYIFAGLLGDDEDENAVFRFTGAFPRDPATAKRWRDKGLTENTLYIGGVAFNTTKGVGQNLFGPLIMAKTMNALRDSETPAETVANDMASIAWALTPAVEQVVQTGVDAERGSKDALGAVKNFSLELAGRGVPFSGLIKSLNVRPEKGIVDKRNSFASIFQNNPLHVNEDADGVIFMENLLGERLDMAGGFGETLRRVGSPIYWKGKSEGRDPVKARLMEIVAEKGYSGGGINYPNLKKKLEQEGIELSMGVLNSYRKVRYREIQNQMLDREAELKAADEKEASAIMRSITTKARKRADESLGLKPIQK